MVWPRGGAPLGLGPSGSSLWESLPPGWCLGPGSCSEGCWRPGEPHSSSCGPARPCRFGGSPGMRVTSSAPCVCAFPPRMAVSASQGRAPPLPPGLLQCLLLQSAWPGVRGGLWSPASLSPGEGPGPQRGSRREMRKDARSHPVLQVPSRISPPRAEAASGPSSSSPAECSGDPGLCQEEPESILITSPRRAAFRERTGGDQTPQPERRVRL